MFGINVSLERWTKFDKLPMQHREEMDELYIRNIENLRLILSICSEQEIEPIHESSTKEEYVWKKLKEFIFTYSYLYKS